MATTPRFLYAAVCITSFVINSAEIYNYGYIKASMTKEDAESHCREKNLTLPLAIEISDMEQIKKIMTDKKLEETWVPIKRKTNNEWMRIGDLKHFMGKEPLRSGGSHNCSSLRRKSHYALDCFREAAAVCKREKCPHCIGTCYKPRGESGMCFDQLTQKGNWFYAAGECTKVNGSLIQSEDEIHVEIEEPEFWTGIVRSWWEVSLPRGDITPLTWDFWHSKVGEEKSGMNCVLLSRESTRWRQEGCQNSHSFLCVNQSFAEYEEPPKVVTRTKRVNQGISKQTIGILVGAGAGGGIIIVIVVALIVRRCRREAQKREGYDVKLVSVKPGDSDIPMDVPPPMNGMGYMGSKMTSMPTLNWDNTPSQYPYPSYPESATLPHPMHNRPAMEPPMSPGYGQLAPHVSPRMYSSAGSLCKLNDFPDPQAQYY